MLYTQQLFQLIASSHIKRNTASCRASMSLTVTKTITDWMYYHMYLAYQWLLKHCYWNHGKILCFSENVTFMAKFFFSFFKSFVVLKANVTFTVKASIPQGVVVIYWMFFILKNKCLTSLLKGYFRFIEFFFFQNVFVFLIKEQIVLQWSHKGLFKMI